MSREVPQFKSVIRDATYSDCLTLAPNLRQEDKDEVWESGSFLPEEALIASLKASQHVKVGVVGDEIVCMFGISNTKDPKLGIPWLLGSDSIRKFSKEFLTLNKEVLDEMSKEYRILANYVWSKNPTHIRWLEWLGFTVTRTPICLGRNQEHFYYFYKNKGINHV